MDVVGLVVILLFYAVIFVIGILAARWFHKRVLEGASSQNEWDVALVAGRQLGVVVGVFTMIATSVGGAYINGTAEGVAVGGLLWTVFPVSLCLGMIICAGVYVAPMRRRGCLTMLDALEQRFSPVPAAILFLAALAGDVFWSGAVLAALGSTLHVVIEVGVVVSVVVSAAVAVLYTMVGQLVSVAYTDLAQLGFIAVGLVVSVPFMWESESVQATGGPAAHTDQWLGTITPQTAAIWVDLFIAMTLGSIPWQTLFQRALAMRTTRIAQGVVVAGGIGTLLLGIPPAMVGMIAVSTDWNQTSLGYDPVAAGEASMVLPLALKHLTPRPVALIGLGALAAAVMSSIDSAILSSASMFTQNIYRALIRRKAGRRELMVVQRVSVLGVGATATALALLLPSVYGMFYLAGDLVFVTLFPQLTAALFIPGANGYGSITGFVVGVTLRMCSGEPYLNLPPFIKFPFFSEEEGQLFPFRTTAMLLSLASLVAVSYIVRALFTRGIISPKRDVFHCLTTTLKTRDTVSKTTNDDMTNNDNDSGVQDMYQVNGEPNAPRISHQKNADITVTRF